MSAPQLKLEEVEELLQSAETALRNGAGTLAGWGEEALALLDRRPGVLPLVAGLSGFVTGTLLRQSRDQRRRLSQRPALNPLLLLAGGLVAGTLAGPKLLDRAILGLNRLNQRDNLFDLKSSRRSMEEVMNEKPFEKP